MVAVVRPVLLGRARTEQAKDAGSVRIERNTDATEDAGMRRFAAGHAGCGGGGDHYAVATSALAGSDSTCVTGSFVSFLSRPTRSLRSQPDFVPGNVDTMSSSVLSS